MRAQIRQLAEAGLAGFREAVRARPELRSDEGVAMLEPVVSRLRLLSQLEPAGGAGAREVQVRLAECLVLSGDWRGALAVSQSLSADGRSSYRSTALVFRGFARLLGGEEALALADFQAVLGHPSPHPCSCVRALCGRGLLRMLAGRPYLAALDYATASRLRLDEAALTVQSLVPWNHRGLLAALLLEEGRGMLEQGRGMLEEGRGMLEQPGGDQEGERSGKKDSNSTPSTKKGDPAGVHSLALLLMELDPSSDPARVLAADALYRLGRVEEAHRLLLVAREAHRTPVLARLTLLQLHRGFLYDANQLLKKVVQLGVTSCLLPILSVFEQPERSLMQQQCHSTACRILSEQQGEPFIKEAVAYLSLAIIASGGGAVDSLLSRARCYASLGQHKTAIFDFSAILREHTEHVRALCGQGFTYLVLNQQKEATQDIVSALRVDTPAVTRDILSLKDQARTLVCDWLHQHGRTALAEITAANQVPCGEELLKEVLLIGGALVEIDSRSSQWHLLYIDALLAKGALDSASSHLRQVFGQEPREPPARARSGVVEAWLQNPGRAARDLSEISERDPETLNFLLTLTTAIQRAHLTQAAAQEAGSLSQPGQSERTLGFLTLAVHAAVARGGPVHPGYWGLLRDRARCLAGLGFHERAVADLDRLIQNQGPSPHDLCSRGHSLLLACRERPALRDYMRALDLAQPQALACVDVGPGRTRLAQCFHRGALESSREGEGEGGQRGGLEEAGRLIEYGLLLDESNTELRKLRSRIKREAGGCIVH
ncbi:tetratricopeptide repeat protein 34-like [Acipenser ruthenus]|uniref:tetratricopeptide repeat protein 34-like n=1 Tax=Acipenser ruthenus TaxID=7906 RepID=UPI0027419CD0|nr:tetratricopeptide repeat protein 34-like [Acipenser ruthenus]